MLGYIACSLSSWVTGIISGIMIIKNKEVTRKSYNILRINFFCTIVATIPLFFPSKFTLFLIPYIMIIIIVKVLMSKIYSSEHNWY